MTIPGCRSARLAVAALALVVPACSHSFVVPNGDGRSDCGAALYVVDSLRESRRPTDSRSESTTHQIDSRSESTTHQIDSRSESTTQRPAVSEWAENRPDASDRLLFDLDLALDDARHFYSWEGLGGLALGIAAVAPLANTTADRDIHRWYQQRVKTSSLNTTATAATYAGQLWVLAPLSLEAMALMGKAGEDYWMDGGLYEWGNRSLRAVALGYPPAVALYGLLGSGRPDRNDARWHPFRYFHGVSGHTFIGAVPFLTAAAMTDEPLLKAPLVLGSFLTGWARLHEDKHYFSQVALGWWIALLSVRSVGQTQKEQSSLSLSPFTPDGPGVSVQVRY